VSFSIHGIEVQLLGKIRDETHAWFGRAFNTQKRQAKQAFEASCALEK